MSTFMCQFPYFVCPIEYNESLGRMSMDCEPSVLFRPAEYTLPSSLAGVMQIVSYTSETVQYCTLTVYNMNGYFTVWFGHYLHNAPIRSTFISDVGIQ